MDLSRHFILLDGQPKTMQIDAIRKNGSKGYLVRFKNNPKSYSYNYNKVLWLSNPTWIDPTHCKVFVSGKEEREVREVWEFASNYKVYRRIVCKSGYVIDDANGLVRIEKSCLGEEKAKDIFAYLKNVAFINPLGKDKDSNGILSELYERIDFVDTHTAAACYLNPDKHSPRQLNHADLVFPFGCNASQKKAVTSAFEHQVSVIQGPPGTGKTQTILNIIANIVRQGKTVLVVSNNNSATANVQEKLDKYGLSFIVAPLGSKENKDAFIAHQSLVPKECDSWEISATDVMTMSQELRAVLEQFDKILLLSDKNSMSCFWLCNSF